MNKRKEILGRLKSLREKVVSDHQRLEKKLDFAKHQVQESEIEEAWQENMFWDGILSERKDRLIDLEYRLNDIDDIIKWAEANYEEDK